MYMCYTETKFKVVGVTVDVNVIVVVSFSLLSFDYVLFQLL